MAKVIRILAILSTLGLAACGVSPDGPPAPDPAEVARLAQTVSGFAPDVDPEEARRLAEISYSYARQLAIDYNVTDPPLIHNMKVNMGLRERGLCYQWADDIEARLRQENFRTLEFHRAIANADNLLIDHSVVIVSRKGDTMFQGVVLDGWRDSGKLFWSPVLEDKRYTWVPREDVFEERRRQEAAWR